ncbi:MAG: hypothetical protein CMF39_00980 [Legionellaceae bacterium]|nr:hypothetical protein [Legionellaceae bacterium]
MTKGFRWTRLIPLLALAIALLIFFATGLHRYLTFSTLKAHREQLLAWTDKNHVIAAIIYIIIYVIAAAISIPGATVLTLIGGFLFGLWLGTFYVVISATIGACLIFLAAKTALSDLLKRKAGKFINKLEKEFKANSMSYLLFLRLVPIFPFWLINIVAGLFGVTLTIFFITTFFGIIPGSFVYVSIGNGLGALLAEGKAPDLSIIFKPAILLPLLGLAILSLLPIVYKKWKTKSGGKNELKK